MTKKFTSSTKASYLEQFHQSGLTQTAFCKQQGLVFKTFNKWLKDLKLPTVKLPPIKSTGVDLNFINAFQNGAVATTKQAAFMPIHLNDADFCESSTPKPPDPDCSVASSSASLKNVFHQSVLGFKTNRFHLDIPLDLATDYGQAALKNLIHVLHQLPGEQNSYD
jgi:hypothetical protein